MESIRKCTSREMQLMDHDDMHIEAVRLLKENPAFSTDIAHNIPIFLLMSFKIRIMCSSVSSNSLQETPVRRWG